MKKIVPLLKRTYKERQHEWTLLVHSYSEGDRESIEY